MDPWDLFHLSSHNHSRNPKTTTQTIARSKQQFIMTFSESISQAFQGGFRTRVGAGVAAGVKEAYDKATTTFPEVLADGGTGARFSDLEHFYMASDSRRGEMLNAEMTDMREWQAIKQQLESEVEANNQAISKSKKKIAEWKQLIADKQRVIDVHEDKSLSE